VPYHVIDGVIHGAKDLFADNMPVIVGPTSNEGVELVYQCPGIYRFIRLYDVPNLVEECLDILLRRRYQQLALFTRLVLAHMLAQEIKPVLNLREACLLLREFQPPLPQELLDEGFDFVFQHHLRAASDNEVVRVPNQVDLGVVADFGLGKMMQQQPFETIQRQVRQRWRDYASYNGAKRVVELQFSTSIPRARLRPGYGVGFQGAPLTCSSSPSHPDPRAQEQDCDLSKTDQAPDTDGPADL
jgi:hypothetical protein